MRQMQEPGQASSSQRAVLDELVLEGTAAGEDVGTPTLLTLRAHARSLQSTSLPPRPSLPAPALHRDCLSLSAFPAGLWPLLSALSQLPECILGFPFHPLLKSLNSLGPLVSGTPHYEPGSPPTGDSQRGSLLRGQPGSKKLDSPSSTPPLRGHTQLPPFPRALLGTEWGTL